MLTHGEGRDATRAHGTRGNVVNMPAWAYDLVARWFVMRGRERTFRQLVVDQARLEPGEAVLDVGCGSGTLAMAARERVGETGRVAGIDPSPRLVAGARRKAARRGVAVEFQRGGIELLPWPDRSFDVVLSTFVMHHLPPDVMRQGMVEIARVLRPGGRLLVVDFDVEHQPALMREAGFSDTETGAIPFRLRRVGGHSGHGFAMGTRAAP